MSQQSKIKLTASGAGIIRVLRDMFSNENSYIREIAQNAVRAGASSLKINFNEKNQKLTFEDNGVGFSDKGWKAYLTIAESAWEANDAKEQNPFGIGCAAAFYKSDVIKVTSNKKQLVISTIDLHEGSEATLKPIKRKSKGTLIELVLNEPETLKCFQDNIEKLFEAFTIPVFFNGREISRPLSLDNSKYKYETKSGTVVAGKRLQSACYGLVLQGFVLDQTESYNRIRASGDTFIHLNNGIFSPRVPDRTTLTNCLQDIELVTNEIIPEVYRRHLSILKLELGKEEFCRQYWRDSLRFCQEILRDCPLNTEDVFCLTSLPYQTENQSEIMVNGFTDKVVFEKEFKSSILFPAPSYTYNGSIFNDWNEDEVALLEMGSIALMSESKIFDIESIPTGHWIEDYVVDSKSFSNKNVIVTPINPSEPFDLSDYKGVISCDGMNVEVVGLKSISGKPLQNLKFINCRHSCFFGNLFIPKTYCAYSTIRHLECCRYDSGDYFELDETELELRINRLDQELKFFLSDNVEDLISDLLIEKRGLIQSYLKRKGVTKNLQLNLGVSSKGVCSFS